MFFKILFKHFQINFFLKIPHVAAAIYLEQLVGLD